MQAVKADIIKQHKIFFWNALTTGVILLIPLIAMQFTSEVNWGPEDFIAMGALIFGMGSLYIGIARIAPPKYRTLIAVGCVAALLLLWVHLAVGIVDSWPLAGS